MLVACALLAPAGMALLAQFHPRPAQAAEEVWFCPMHAHVTSDHAGSCPICGMNLVKRSDAAAEAHGHDEMDHAAMGHGAAEPSHRHMDHSRAPAKPNAQSAETFHVAPSLQKHIGLAVEPAERSEFRATLRVPAQVVADEQRAVSLSPRVEGWIERLGVSVVGQRVRKGQMLYEIYSPELQQRQKDFLDLLTRRDSLLAAKGAGGMAALGNSPPDLMLASVARERYRVRRRLLAAGVPPSALAELEKFRRVHEVVPVLAEHDGVVTSLLARQGAFVRPGEPILGYADRHAAWAELSINPERLPQLQEADEVELRSTIDSAATFTAPLDASLATIDPVSRTARLRVPLEASDDSFLPGTLLDAEIHLRPRQAIAVRTDAVLRTGRGDYVVLAESDDHFRQAPVRLGAENESRVEVLEGLVPGQRVVTNGQFMLSAEGALHSSWRRLAGGHDPTHH